MILNVSNKKKKRTSQGSLLILYHYLSEFRSVFVLRLELLVAHWVRLRKGSPFFTFLKLYLKFCFYYTRYTFCCNKIFATYFLI